MKQHNQLFKDPKSEEIKSYLSFALKKEKYSINKKIMFSFMAGLFVGLGYGVFLIITQSNIDPTQPKYMSTILTVLGASIFPIALFLCMFLGGNLFTSNSMIFIGSFYHKIKIIRLLKDLLITIVFNALGCLCIAALLWAVGMFGGINGEILKDSGINSIISAKGKLNSTHLWYNNLFGGILCNIIVSGSIMLFINCQKKGFSIFLIHLLIMLFAICSFQHIVANLYLFAQAGIISLNLDPSATFEGQSLIFNSSEVGKIFYNNLIPTTIGNFIGGVFILLVYIFAHEKLSISRIKK